MKCPSCATENSKDNRFCAMCGAKLQLLCPECGASSDPSLRFCGACGAKLEKTAEKAQVEVEPPKVPVESAEGWISEFRAVGWGPEVIFGNDLSKSIPPRDGEKRILSGRSSLDMHIFLRGFDASDMMLVAGFIGTNFRLIILTSKMGSRQVDPVLQIDYKELRGVKEIKEAEARKDMREVDGLLRISLQGEEEPVDLLVLNKKARTPLLKFLQTASSMAVAAPIDLRQATPQSLTVEGDARKAQDAVEAVRQDKPVGRETLMQAKDEASSQREQQSSAKKGWSTKRKVLVGCGITSLVLFIAVVGICVAVVNNSGETDVPTTYSINEEATVGKAIWELLEAKDRGSVLQGAESEFPMFTEDKISSGKFIEITLQVTNTGTITESYWSDPNLIDDRGTVFKPADGVYEWIPDDNEALLEPLQPRVTRQFIWIYEVPADATGLKVRVNDIAFGSDAKALIDLGL